MHHWLGGMDASEFNNSIALIWGTHKSAKYRIMRPKKAN